jgi:dTDP-4-dehydrorhamnose reductase
VISTNEVFDGQRGDGLGYGETDVPRPINAYGASKLAGEVGALAAFEMTGRPQDVLIVRTAWLFGPPGNDFPAKIVAAADRLPADEPLKVVIDEVGSPTYTIDLAQAIVTLISTAGTSGVYHMVNAGQASRFELAARVLAGRRPGRAIVPISRAQFDRPSAPPAWAVLRSTRSLPANGALRPWSDAIDAYLPSLG